MFGLFKKKKTMLQELIEKDGFDHATQRVAEVICSKLTNEKYAYQFVLEEIEAASMGNQDSKLFADRSGIAPQEYKGAMRRSSPEIDGPDGPQQYLVGASMQLMSDKNLMIRFRTTVVDNVMKHWAIGKYQ